jgi:hypothetical protein
MVMMMGVLEIADEPVALASTVKALPPGGSDATTSTDAPSCSVEARLSGADPHRRLHRTADMG